MNRLISFFFVIALISCSQNNSLIDHGAITEFDQSGNTIITVDTVQGEFNGTLNYYFSNGNIKSIQNWRNGFPDGDFTFYNENGDTIQREIYNYSEMKHNLLVGDSLNYFVQYDSLLINFYAKHLIISPDTGYYIKMDNYIKTKNIPYYILLATSNNGLIQPYENYLVSKIKTTTRDLRIDFYVRSTAGIRKISSITRHVKELE
jgi:hypothetical protein